jgi:hypothetical protein
MRGNGWAVQAASGHSRTGWRTLSGATPSCADCWRWQVAAGLSEATDWRAMRRGSCWGSKECRAEMREWVGKKQGGQHHGEELRESEEPRAERLAGRMLRAAGWTQRELHKRPNGDKRRGNGVAFKYSTFEIRHVMRASPARPFGRTRPGISEGEWLGYDGEPQRNAAKSPHSKTSPTSHGGSRMTDRCPPARGFRVEGADHRQVPLPEGRS